MKNMPNYSSLLKQLLPSPTLVDPTARIEGLFAAVKTCFEKNEYRMEPDEPDFQLAALAISKLAHYGIVLNRLEFWDDLDLPNNLLPETLLSLTQIRVAECSGK